jgi:iron(III) transport system substrate-binding protein
MLEKTIGRFALPVALIAATLVATVVASLGAQSKPLSVAELALYQGADREKVLLEGAKKEGQVTFYTSNTWVAGPISQEFEKKYPFVKVNVWRSDSKALLKRLTEELTASRAIADVVETSPEYISIMLREKMLQEHFSELSAYDDEAKIKGKLGVYAWTNREIYISLGFNSKITPPAEAPKSIKDYLDPKWKGKMSIAGTTTGVQWVGALLDLMGREFLDKLSAQEINAKYFRGSSVGIGRVWRSTSFTHDLQFQYLYPQAKRRTGGMAPA